MTEEIMDNLISVDLKYQAGICNIGPAEINKRKQAFYLSFISSLILTLILMYRNINTLWSLFLIIPFTVTAVNYLQVKNKFCVYFGFFSIFNFDDLGEDQNIKNNANHKKDLRKVRKMFSQSILFGLVITFLFYFLLF